MARAALTDDELQAFRAKAVRVATKLFAECGYDGVTMRAIAKKLGTSPMATYRYFANKAEIFALVRAAAMHDFVDYFEREAHADLPALARLVRVREAYARFALDHPERYRILFELPEAENEYPEVIAANRRARDSLLKFAQLAIDLGLYTGDPLIVAHVMWAHIHGLVSLHLAGKLNAGLGLQQLLLATQPIGLAASSQGKATEAKARVLHKPRAKRKANPR
jgi:AcrR family transcriptional regulator